MSIFLNYKKHLSLSPDRRNNGLILTTYAELTTTKCDPGHGLKNAAVVVLHDKVWEQRFFLCVFFFNVFSRMQD